MLVLLCFLRGVTLYYWWQMPNIEMATSPAIYKGVQYPGVSFATLLIGIPSILILLLPILRTIPRVLFIAGIFFCFGIASLVATFYLSFNVAGGGGLFLIVGMHLYREAVEQYNA